LIKKKNSIKEFIEEHTYYTDCIVGLVCAFMQGERDTHSALRKTQNIVEVDDMSQQTERM